LDGYDVLEEAEKALERNGAIISKIIERFELEDKELKICAEVSKNESISMFTGSTVTKTHLLYKEFSQNL